MLFKTLLKSKYFFVVKNIFAHVKGKQLTPQYYDIRILLGQRIPFQQMLNNEKYHPSRLFEVDPFYYSNHGKWMLKCLGGF